MSKLLSKAEWCMVILQKSVWYCLHVYFHLRQADWLYTRIRYTVMSIECDLFVCIHMHTMGGVGVNR